MTRGIGHPADAGNDVAFIPLAMPIMFGSGAIVTVLGMTLLMKHSAIEFVYFAATCADARTGSPSSGRPRTNRLVLSGVAAKLGILLD